MTSDYHFFFFAVISADFLMETFCQSQSGDVIRGPGSSLYSGHLTSRWVM